MNPIAEKYIRKSALPTIFCPGCGHGTVLNTFLRLLDDLGLFANINLVSGIGCSSWTPVFIDADVIHSLHGRALAVATGLKLAQPTRDVFVFSGDGDCVGIGGNHFIHAARRNIDLTVLMLDNYIYGMTGGQVAPTTPLGARTQTSPWGNPEPPLDACALAVSCGAAYVARTTTARPDHLYKMIKEGYLHKGFSFIHVLSQCPTQAGRYIHGSSSGAEMVRMLKNNSIPKAKAEKMTPEELAGKFIIGRLHQDDGRPEFTETVHRMIKSASSKK
ncbi:MAG: thiamine pyrophosphate-dependent enzyme [Thermodesulfobacteriota bacterium]